MAISKAKRLIGYAGLAILATGFLTMLLLNFYLKKEIVSILQQQVIESTHGEYALSLDRVKINWFTQRVVLTNLCISPVKRHPEAKAQYIFQAKALRIYDISILSLLHSRDLQIDLIKVEEPQFSIYQGISRINEEPEDTVQRKKSFFTAFSQKLNSISVTHIEIPNSSFNVYKHGIDSAAVFTSSDNSVSIDSFKINAETDKLNQYFTARKFDVALNSFAYQLNNGLYKLTGNTLGISFTDSTLTLDSLQLIPKFSKETFAEHAGRQASRVHIVTSKINCKRVDLPLLLDHSSLVMNRLDIEGCIIDSYRDNTKPLGKVECLSIQAMLRDLPFYMAIDTIEMHKARVDVEMLNPGYKAHGEITLTDFHVLITGVQNDTVSYTDSSAIAIRLDARIMNQGKLDVHFTFPLDTRKESFKCSGSVSAMPMAAFNPLLRHTKQLVFKSGMLDHVSFSFVAQDQNSRGNMKFLYHDLQIELLNYKGKKSTLKLFVKSFLVNTFVFENSNPGKDGKVRIATIRAQRNPYRYFLNFAMQSLLSGIEPSVLSEDRPKIFKKVN